MKEDTKEVISKLIDALKLQNDAMKAMAQQIKDLQETVEELKKSTKTEVHNHYHNNYSYPRYPYYGPTWGGGVVYTTNKTTLNNADFNNSVVSNPDNVSKANLY